MPEDLLNRIVGEVRARLRESRAAYEESRRLEAALAALDHDSAEDETVSTSSRSLPRRPSGQRPARAPRGENLRRIRAALDERPGATAGEVAAATGITRTTVASTMGKRARDGEFERTQLPSGRVGYRRASN